MLSLNEIKIGSIIEINGEPFVVVKSDHHKMGRGGAVLKTKLKNLINGNVLERTFQGNDKVERANTERKKANFMYKDVDNANFMDNESYEQFTIEIDQVADKLTFVKEGTDVDVLYFDGKAVAIDPPIKVELLVTSAPPGVKGNSAGNITKQIEVETGAVINAPMFINEGDRIKVNTDTGEYVERA